MKTWHIITCEYPPQIGGVSDYTRLLAQQLTLAGDRVHIWAPAHPAQPEGSNDSGFHVHRTLGDFSPPNFTATEKLIYQFDTHQPRTFLVQWVPHGYGKRSMNLAFCKWLQHRAKTGDRLEVMIHEPYLESGQGSWKQRFVAQVHRRMIRKVLGAASRVFISIPAWERYLRPYAPTKLQMDWLPIPATVLVSKDDDAAKNIRQRFGAPTTILGHLGTYSSAITPILSASISCVLRDVPNTHALLMGNGSEEFRSQLAQESPELSTRIHAAGYLTNPELSHCLSACDLMLQPFPDGLSSRRTSLMNALAHGITVVSHSGHLTEDVWEQAQAVALARTGTAHDLAETCTRLLNNPEERKTISAQGLAFYHERFDWPNIIATLRSSPDNARAAVRT